MARVLNFRDVCIDSEIAKKFGIPVAKFRKLHCRPSQVGQILEHQDGSRYQFVDEHALYKRKGLWIVLPPEYPTWLTGKGGA